MGIQMLGFQKETPTGPPKEKPVPPEGQELSFVTSVGTIGVLGFGIVGGVLCEGVQLQRSQVSALCYHCLSLCVVVAGEELDCLPCPPAIPLGSCLRQLQLLATLLGNPALSHPHPRGRGDRDLRPHLTSSIVRSEHCVWHLWLLLPGSSFHIIIKPGSALPFKTLSDEGLVWKSKRGPGWLSSCLPTRMAQIPLHAMWVP